MSSHKHYWFPIQSYSQTFPIVFWVCVCGCYKEIEHHKIEHNYGNPEEWAIKAKKKGENK